MAEQSRYWIGIDLGTTNSVVAYGDKQAQRGSEPPEIRVLEVPQLVAEGEVCALPVLPSFLYFPPESASSANAFALPWEAQATSVVGVLAREQGALVAGRQVSSAKSWLCQGAVDRRAGILPWEAEPSEPKVSPVEASARYLTHLRNAWNEGKAWNDAIAGGEETRFEDQDIVLTVPASFDEEARELTVEAAHQAGLHRFTLLEEPMAAFYAWIAKHRNLLEGQLAGTELHDGDLVLICDIGGGTTDFSLIRVRMMGASVQFERTAIGEHLLLGGDNLDLALTRRVEEKLNAGKLSLRQRHSLQRACCAAKERLLSDPALQCLPVNVLGSGRGVVGQVLTAELTREDVLQILAEGFLPLTNASELLKREEDRRESRTGLRELGLPYATSPAITKHLAAFLASASASLQQTRSASRDHPTMVRPDAVLFNGGFCTAPIVRERIVEAISNWFRQEGASRDEAKRSRPIVLDSTGMERAVAVGAAYYARVRHGSGVRIRAGSARSYYVATRSEHGIQAVCVLPHGTEEGTTLPLPNREFTVLANRPVSFTLYSSTVRRDAHGAIAALEEGEIHRHAPLGTLLRYGKKMREQELAVRLRANFTEMGTLELWCESLATDHRWRLRFELRGDAGQEVRDQIESKPSTSTKPESSNIAEQELEAAVGLIRGVFDKSQQEEAIAPEKLVAELEGMLGTGKNAWPIATVRRFCDELAEVAEGRKKSPQSEVRWLNLFGFCLRPGFGARNDEARISQLRKVYLAGPAFAREIPSQVELLVLLRRVAGGLNASQQHELHRMHAATLGLGSKRKERANPQVERDTWRLLAALEHLPALTRVQLGNDLLGKIKKDSNYKTLLWSLGRLGERIPLYGPLNCVVPPEVAEEWLKALLNLKELTAESAFAMVQLGALTGDRARDIGDELRYEVLAKLSGAEVALESRQRLELCMPPAISELERIFGETLPKGLQLVTSPNCLLSVAALTADLPG